MLILILCATNLYIMHQQDHRKLQTASCENTPENQKLNTYRQELGIMSNIRPDVIDRKLCFLLRLSCLSADLMFLYNECRAVAQFLKSRSSATPAVESQSVDVSLKTILEGKRRKVCARMVFETLVSLCTFLVTALLFNMVTHENSKLASRSITIFLVIQKTNISLLTLQFFVLQVLKNCGLIDVHQEESFGDVTLTVTQNLSKKLFST